MRFHASTITKNHLNDGGDLDINNVAGPTGLEPAISSVTGRRDNHFTTSPRLISLRNRGNDISSQQIWQEWTRLDFDVLFRCSFVHERFSEIGDILVVLRDVRSPDLAFAYRKNLDDFERVAGVYNLGGLIGL